MTSIATAKSVVDKTPPAVVIHQASSGDDVGWMIRNATIEQLTVIRDLLRAGGDGALLDSGGAETPE